MLRFKKKYVYIYIYIYICLCKDPVKNSANTYVYQNIFNKYNMKFIMYDREVQFQTSCLK